MEVVARALGSGNGTVAVCFEPVTRQYFSGEPWRRRLSTTWERYMMLTGLGVSSVELVPFREDTVRMGPDEFLSGLLRRLPFRRLVVGYDFHFGRNRSGTVEYLQRWCTSRGIVTIIVPPLEIRGEPVKSERLRLLLEKGDLEEAGELLGRPYSLTGVLARGKGLGRQLGFPTLNVRVPGCKLLPMSGSYCGYVYSGDGTAGMTAAVFVPERATGPVEAHVLDGPPPEAVSGSLARVELVERIRKVVHARSAQELKALIAGDIEVVRRFEEKKGRMEDRAE
jgi:riboflavin kinase/FMN adenylyltransferase